LSGYMPKYSHARVLHLFKCGENRAEKRRRYAVSSGRPDIILI